MKLLHSAMDLRPQGCIKNPKNAWIPTGALGRAPGPHAVRAGFALFRNVALLFESG